MAQVSSSNKNAAPALAAAADAAPRVETHEVVDDAALQGLVGYHMRRVTNLVQADLARVLKDLDLRIITMSVLVVIVDHPGLRQSQLADALSIERPNLVSILDELESRGLVLRTRVPTDRRAYALTPTRAGERLAERALEAADEHERKFFGDLDAKERAQLLSLLGRVRDAAGA
jgi:DNA-binding MarR family transcriptional regulator